MKKINKDKIKWKTQKWLKGKIQLKLNKQKTKQNKPKRRKIEKKKQKK